MNQLLSVAAFLAVFLALGGLLLGRSGLGRGTLLAAGGGGLVGGEVGALQQRVLGEVALEFLVQLDGPAGPSRSS